METTVGKILLKAHLPEDMHAFIDSTELDKGGIAKLFNVLAEKHPNDYPKLVSELTRLGFEVSTRLGSTVRLTDLRSPIDKKARFDVLEVKLSKLRGEEKDPKKYESKANDLYQTFVKDITKELVDVGVTNNQTLAKIIKSGSRGSPVQYMQTVFAPVLVQDNTGRPLVDFPIKRSFAEGLNLPDYLATSFGSRAGEVAKKLCQKFDTEVLTSDRRVKRICDFKVGDKVLGVDLKTMTSVESTVTNVFNNGVQPVYQYTFRRSNFNEDRITFCCTEEHKLAAKELRWSKKGKSDTVFSPIPVGKFTKESKSSKFKGAWYPEFPDKKGVSAPNALFLGLMLGDGCWTRLQAPMLFSCADLSLIEDIERYFSSLNYQLKKSSATGYTYVLKQVSMPKKNTVRGKNYSGDPVRAWLKGLDLIGTYSETKFIPDEVWDWDSASIAQLIGGLFSTDGNILVRDNGNVSLRLTLTSKQMVDRCKELLERVFAIPCSTIHSTAKEKIAGSKNDIYHLKISHRLAVQRFYESIPLVGVKKVQLKHAVVDRLADNNNTDFGCTYLSKEYLGEIATYDIEIDHPSHMFVLANGLVGSNSVADAGYFSKQMSRATMTLRITEHDCGTDNGVDLPVSNREAVGTYLAHPVGGYNKNNEVTAKVLNDLAHKGVTTIIVRSPITCQSSAKFHSNAICQLCAGKREKGLPLLGDYIGITSASTLGEPLAQGQLSLKHSSGSATGPNLTSGFDLVKQLATIPQTFKDKAAVAEHDGVVKEIRVATQGGHYINIGTDEYYIPTGFGLKVKAGESVEAGDVLSEGIVNPSDIVRLKGIGEGRRYFAQVMKRTFDEAGMGGINHRNFEVLSKSMIDHVNITDNNGLGDHLPGDIVSYQAIERNYQPRPDAAKVRVDLAYNKYLESPVLHYTIGTRITKKIIERLRANNIEQVLVSSTHPGFTPEMQRLDALPEHEPDWMHQLYTANLERKLLHAVNTGAFSDTKGASPVPGLAYGVGFGQK